MNIFFFGSEMSFGQHFVGFTCTYLKASAVRKIAEVGWGGGVGYGDGAGGGGGGNLTLLQ